MPAPGPRVVSPWWRPCGEIDLATAGFLSEHLDAATATARPDVLVDLRQVEFFDCSGLRVLCRADTRARGAADGCA